MHVVLFEDDNVVNLYPITIGRPAFSISVGSMRLINLARQLSGAIELVVRPHLRNLLREDAPYTWTPGAGERKGPILFINARTAPHDGLFNAWRALTTCGLEPGAILRSGESVAAAFLNDPTLLPHQEIGCSQLQGILRDLNLPEVETFEPLPLLERSSDAIRYHLQFLNENLNSRIATGEYKEIADGLFVPRDPEKRPVIGDYFVSDSSEGPIILNQGVKIGPFCFIRGPVYIGTNSKVIEHAAIKDYVTISSTCKVGGEVEATTIEKYSNKQHHGFLGHSYVGSWVNLGAGTCNSDLKNSYNEVSQETVTGKYASHMQFLGCVIGDYTKTAINTSIFTGKTLGACCMCYGFVTTAVPSFVNYARSFGQITELPVELMAHAQGRMFVRRNVKQRPCDIKLIQDMYELTRAERQLANEPLSL
ncbi:MAG: glucose-1-phosphate thymidylyltransferase [Thermoguttaceae bacterium]|nr:glucose-1-phosphate thymidylyltransferase [Thermoguttaceae bacterium]